VVSVEFTNRRVHFGNGEATFLVFCFEVAASTVDGTTESVEERTATVATPKQKRFMTS
jgi:hypothetical protein